MDTRPPRLAAGYAGFSKTRALPALGVLCLILSSVPARPAHARIITLAECRSLALARNPDLKIAQEEVEAASGELLQAGSYPNPDFSIETEDFGGDLPGSSESQTTLALSQSIDAFGVRRALADAARAGRSLAQADMDRVRRDLLAEVDRRFARLIAAQMREEILLEGTRIADTLEITVRALAEAGEISPIEVDRVAAERSLIEIEGVAARADAGRARAALSALWSQPDPDSVHAAGSIDDLPQAPPCGAILGSPLPAPERSRSEAEVSMREAGIRAALRARLPSIDLAGGVRRFASTGDHGLVASLSLSLPMFDRNGGAIDAARARAAGARAARDALPGRIAKDRIAACETLQSGIAGAQLLRERVLPGLTQAHEAIREGYRLGKFRLLDVLDARRTLVDARLRYVDALEAVAVARADLEQTLNESPLKIGEEQK